LPKVVYRQVSVHEMVIYTQKDHAYEFRELCKMALRNLEMYRWSYG